MERLERIATKVESLGGDFYITFDEAERFYLTGLSSTFGIALVGKGGNFFITDGRYIERAKEVRNFKVILWKGWEEFTSLLKELKAESLIVDPYRLKAKTYKELSNKFYLIDSEGFLNELRAVKSEREISLITRAVQIAELSLKSVLHLLKPGITEIEFRRALIEAFFKLGGKGEAFPTIVASGRNSAVPHWETGNREIRDGDLVIVDFGTVYGGYVSDITRTFLVGNVSNEARRIYDAVLEAQELGVRELSAGKSCREVDLKVRKFLEDKGYGKFFTHSLGHGIGVEVHEAPTLSQRSKEVLKEGNVITVEPGVYIPEIGGVRIEDDCLITERGAFRLSHLPR